MVQSVSIITTEGKIQTILKETTLSKEVDNNNNKIDVMNIDEVNKTIVENEDTISIKETISIDNKKEREFTTNIEEVRNLNIKSRAVKIVDKENTSDAVEIEKHSKISVKEDFGAASNQNTDKLS